MVKFSGDPVTVVESCDIQELKMKVDSVQDEKLPPVDYNTNLILKTHLSNKGWDWTRRNRI